MTVRECVRGDVCACEPRVLVRSHIGHEGNLACALYFVMRDCVAHSVARSREKVLSRQTMERVCIHADEYDRTCVSGPRFNNAWAHAGLHVHMLGMIYVYTHERQDTYGMQHAAGPRVHGQRTDTVRGLRRKRALLRHHEAMSWLGESIMEQNGA